MTEEFFQARTLMPVPLATAIHCYHIVETERHPMQTWAQKGGYIVWAYCPLTRTFFYNGAHMKALLRGRNFHLLQGRVS